MKDPLDALFWRDEILTILFWLRGEGLGDVVAPGDLSVFLNVQVDFLQEHLDQMVAEGYVERLDGPSPRYQLTEFGTREGGRRFTEEFAGMTQQGHGECNDPNCFCKEEGPQACIHLDGGRH